jgi:hypothetical protein
LTPALCVNNRQASDSGLGHRGDVITEMQTVSNTVIVFTPDYKRYAFLQPEIIDNHVVNSGKDHKSPMSFKLKVAIPTSARIYKA